jgi:hypothetical protein
MTYGWAFLIISVAAAAIYAFGWFDFTDVLPQKCDFFSQVECIDFTATQAEVRIIIANDFNADIMLHNVTITKGGDPVCTSTSIANKDWPIGEKREIILSDCDIEESRLDADLHVTYYHPDCVDCKYTSLGTLDVKVR